MQTLRWQPLVLSYWHFFLRCHNSDVGFATIRFDSKACSRIHMLPQIIIPTTMLYCLNNSLHGELLRVTCPTPRHSSQKKLFVFNSFKKISLPQITLSNMVVNSSKVKKCFDIFVRKMWFFFLCCELKPLLWGAHLTIWALIDIPKSCSTRLATSRVILGSPLITCSTHDHTISLKCTH